MKVNIDIPEDMLKVIDERCAAEFFSRSEWIRTALRDKLFNKEIKVVTGNELVEKVRPNTSTLPVENTIRENAPEVLWEDSNLMPISKVGVDEQYCPNWCKKGVKQRVYPVKKYDVESKLVWEKLLCKDCINKELFHCKSFGGHLE